MAVLAYALQFVGGFIPALVIFLIRRQSRFVSFHSLQVLFLELIYFVVISFTMMFGIAGIMLAVAQSHANKDSFPPVLFMFIPILFLAWMAVFITKLVAGVFYCIKAGRGEWAETPIVGRWARSVLKIAPGGGLVE